MSRATSWRAFAAIALVLTASAAPVAVPAQPVTSRVAERTSISDTLTSRFDVGGVKVILRRNTASEVVAVNLYLLGGSRQVTPATAGIEPLLLGVSERGTKRYPGPAAERALARDGSSVIVSPDYDWTVFGLRSVRSAFDSSWAVFADRLIAPSLRDEDIELVRAQYLAGARERRTSPDDQVELLADSVTFHGHPYAVDPSGTERSLSSITPAMLREYHARELVKSRMLLVVVGNVERPQVERLVRGTLATLPAGNYTWTLPPDPVREGSVAHVVSRQLPTNYILGYFVGPRAASADYPALRLATAVLAGNLFSEIRTERQLSYAAGAPFVERALGIGGMYVSTVAPDEALAVMRDEVAAMKRELLAPEALQRLVQRFIIDYYLKNETNGDQANGLARAELYRGDYRAAFAFEREMRAVTPEAVRDAAQRYMRGVRFVYVGDPSRVRRDQLERF